MKKLLTVVMLIAVSNVVNASATTKDKKEKYEEINAMDVKPSKKQKLWIKYLKSLRKL